MSGTTIPLVLAVGAATLFAVSCADSHSRGSETTSTAARVEATIPPGRRISVTSTAFTEGARLPDEYTCAGKSEVPPLDWTVPPDTATFALIVDDPDAPDGVFTHWVVTDLPITTTAVGPDHPLTTGTVLPNSTDRPDYAAPCPPPGTGPHHYRFTVYALPHPLSLAPQTNSDQARIAVEQTATAQGRITATYAR
ncbi:YbhB/YbcL family Raf kinase inhibitor-like protein [Nocardia sp. NPDC003482]|uniref:YbhB/YbcL family Raf kinase inhibitor-like protein n=1 Tax=Nocardia sp. NPDC004068 TaxID=3364303 RepID=UPI0036BC423D